MTVDPSLLHLTPRRCSSPGDTTSVVEHFASRSSCAATSMGTDILCDYDSGDPLSAGLALHPEPRERRAPIVERLWDLDQRDRSLVISERAKRLDREETIACAAERTTATRNSPQEGRGPQGSSCRDDLYEHKGLLSPPDSTSSRTRRAPAVRSSASSSGGTP